MSTIKPLSQLSIEAEIREGNATSAINRFLARFNGLPLSIKKDVQDGVLKVKTATYYDTVYNETTTPSIHFFPAETRRDVKVGLTNLPYNRLEASEIFFVDSVRLLHGEIKESNQAITQAEKATAANVLAVNYFDTALPTNIANGTFQVHIGGQDVVTNLLMSKFVDDKEKKARPEVKLENVFLAEGKPFGFTVHLAGTNLKVSDALRLEVSGVLITK